MLTANQSYSWSGFVVLIENGVMTVKFSDTRYTFNFAYNNGEFSFTNPTALGGAISLYIYYE